MEALLNAARRPGGGRFASPPFALRLGGRGQPPGADDPLDPDASWASSPLGAAGAPGAAQRPLCMAPPLAATLQLYAFLHATNHTLVFLTGRSEASRADTAANLALAGYGQLCPAPAAAGASAGAAAAAGEAAPAAAAAAGSGAAGALAGRRSGVRRRLAQLGLQQGGDLAGSSNGRAPCYAGLLMRVDGDTRLASVFKVGPRERGPLQTRLLHGSRP